MQLTLQASYLQAVGITNVKTYLCFSQAVSITNVKTHFCFSVKASTSFALDKEDSASGSSSSFDEKDKDKDELAPPKNKCEYKFFFDSLMKSLFVQQCK